MTNDEIDRIVKEKFCTDFYDEFKVYGRENTVLPSTYDKYADLIQNFHVRDDDVFVATYPKVGTTWTQEMVWMIANNLDFVRGQETLSARFPFIEICSLTDYPEDVPYHSRKSLEYADKLKSPRFLKTHLPFSLLPNEIQTGAKSPKIINVIRNPKDVCVSYHHHCRLLEGLRADLEEFAKVFLAGKEMYGSFWNHIFGYWNQRRLPNLLIIKYEDMKQDIKSVIRKVARFLDKNLSEDQVELLSKHLSFDSMKNNPSIDYDAIIDEHRKKGLTADEGSFFRSGTTGQYKEELSPETIMKINEWTKLHVSGTSFEKEYDYTL